MWDWDLKNNLMKICTYLNKPISFFQEKSTSRIAIARSSIYFYILSSCNYDIFVKIFNISLWDAISKIFNTLDFLSNYVCFRFKVQVRWTGELKQIQGKVCVRNSQGWLKLLGKNYEVLQGENQGELVLESDVVRPHAVKKNLITY